MCLYLTPMAFGIHVMSQSCVQSESPPQEDAKKIACLQEVQRFNEMVLQK